MVSLFLSLKGSNLIKVHVAAVVVLISVPCFAELPKAKFDACMALSEPSERLNCGYALLREQTPPTQAPAKLAPATLIARCRAKSGPCSFLWSGIIVTMNEDRAWLEVPKPFVPGRELIEWTIVCSRDRMTDRRACALSPGDRGEGLHINYTVTGRRISVDTYENGFPHSRATIRVGGNAAQSVREDQAFSASATTQIIKQMGSAKTIATRYFDWPRNHPQDNVFNLEGFSAIIRISDAFANS
jgi:hypothetical protein